MTTSIRERVDTVRAAAAAKIAPVEIVAEPFDAGEVTEVPQ